MVAEALRAACPSLKHLVCIDGEAEGALSLDELTAVAAPTPPAFITESDDVIALMPTGGTTGLPKGVMQTNRNLSLSILNGVINSPYAPGERNREPCSSPDDAFGGVSVDLRHSARRQGRGADQTRSGLSARHHRAGTRNRTFLPPTVIYALLEVPGIETRDFSSLRYIMYGAAPMSLDKLRRAIEVFG